VFSGGILKYFLLVNVTGNGSNVTVVEIYPGNISFISSEPPPTVGNDTWNLGNLNNQAFQINITVNVSSTFTGLLLNNATAFVNYTNGSTINASDNETTLVIAPPPPGPTGPGGGSGGGPTGCAFTNMTVKIGGQLKKFYTCCTDEDCQDVWRFPKNYACRAQPPLLLQRVCLPIAELQRPAMGICPIQRTCGALCCPMGTMCVNSQCRQPGKAEPVQVQMPAPPENYYVLSISEVGLLWLLFLMLLILILLFVTIFLAAMDEQKKKRKK